MSNKICSIDGCESTHYGRGWCQMHYKRWKKHGTTDDNLLSHNAEARFLGRLKREGDCLIYQAGQRGLYVDISVDGRRRGVHRYAWERVNGPIPEGMQIDHICHNTRCVEISHLRLALPHQNGANRSGPLSHSKTGVRNVRKHRDGWQVQIVRKGEIYYFGKFYDLEEAAEVAKQARRRLFGEFAGRDTDA